MLDKDSFVNFCNKYPKHQWIYDSAIFNKDECSNIRCSNCRLKYSILEKHFYLNLFRYYNIWLHDNECISCNVVDKLQDHLINLSNHQTNIITNKNYSFRVAQQLTYLCFINEWPPFWITPRQAADRKYPVTIVDGHPTIPFKMFKGHVNPDLFNIAQLDWCSPKIIKNRNNEQLNKLMERWIVKDVLK